MYEAGMRRCLKYNSRNAGVYRDADKWMQEKRKKKEFLWNKHSLKKL